MPGPLELIDDDVLAQFERVLGKVEQRGPDVAADRNPDLRGHPAPESMTREVGAVRLSATQNDVEARPRYRAAVPTFLLIDREGSDLGTLRVSEHAWHPGDVIPRGTDSLRVVDVLEAELEGGDYATLVVEPVE